MNFIAEIPFSSGSPLLNSVLGGWHGRTVGTLACTDGALVSRQEAPYADKIRSYSKPGESQIIFQIKDSSKPGDVANVWYTVRKKVGDMRFTLPQGIQGPFFNDEFGDVYSALYMLTADGLSLADKQAVNDDIKILAIQSMQRTDPARALPLLSPRDYRVVEGYVQSDDPAVEEDRDAVAEARVGRLHRGLELLAVAAPRRPKFEHHRRLSEQRTQLDALAIERLERRGRRRRRLVATAARTRVRRPSWAGRRNDL